MLKRFFLKERNILILILINAVVIYLLYFKQFHNNFWLINVDHLFVLIFLLEAIVKINALKPKTYFSDGWNRFDFIIAMVSLPSLVAYMIPIPNTSILKILRLFRLIRLVRFFRFIPHVEMIMAGLTRAVKASVFVFVALFFLNFILALITCHFYSELAPSYFGNPMLSTYSIFQMFTIEGWNEIPALIAQKLDNPFLAGITRFYFVMVVLIGGIFGMSLANAVFVDEMTIDNNKELEKKIESLQTKIEELKTLIDNK